jgi:hypothetical protein
MQYIGIRSEGGLIPYDILDSIANEEAGLGQQAKDFGLPAGRRLTDEIARAWSDAQDYWHIFQRRSASLPESETGTTLTRKWVTDLLNDLLGYELTYQPSGAVILGKNYPISHRAGTGEESPPVHVEGSRIELDRRPQGRRLSPQALVQEYLNNSEGHLWGIVTNGLLLRSLRDTSRMSRPTYLEFDLQSILDGNRFNEFALFYRVCHRTRLPKTADDSTSCWLERYFQRSIEEGGRVRDKLRVGVEDALKKLGTGLLRHPSNTALRERVKSGALPSAEFHRQLLRLVYRLLFLMVAEERRMIVPEAPDSERRQRLYDAYYSVGRLRGLAEKYIEPSAFGDLWIGLQKTFALFEDGSDSNPLGIPPLNGALFSDTVVKDLHGTHLYNDDLLSATKRLSLFEDHRVLQRVNYGALDVEELGSVYESLLDYQPVCIEDVDGLRFDLRIGGERKSTGSYYTRPELVRELIESALVPVMQDRLTGAKDAEAAKQKERQERAILSMTVCDPACGSGHFLLAAARRLGRELAKVRTGEDEPTPKEFHLAVRDVIAHCIHGVDVNPLAVDLCKLALWLEGHWTGKPLSFLDHRIKLGNSLIGVLDMEVLKQGIPDEAFTPVTGDDKKVASAFKKKNRDERKGQPTLPFDAVEHVHAFAQQSEQFVSITEDTPADVRRKKDAYEKSRQRPDWWHDWVGANVWTAAFFLPLTIHDDPIVPTYDKFVAYLRGKHVDARLEGSSVGLATELHFFHWPLEFPAVFESGGFDVVLGNPPWERIKLQEKEHWLDDPYIANAANKAERSRRIEEYRLSGDPRKCARVARFLQEKHASEAEGKFSRHAGRFPLSAVGDVNTYALFVELARQLISPVGRVGILVPTGIVTDDTTKALFGDIIKSELLVRVLGFENEAFIFPDVHHAFKFCALTLSGKATKIERADLVFWCRHFRDIVQPERHFYLSAKDLGTISPNTHTCPTFRTGADAALAMKIYRTINVLWDENTNNNPWRIQFLRMIDMANDSDLFLTEEAPDSLKLYEAKMMHQFDHRWGTYENATKENIAAGILPQVPESKKRDFAYEVLPRYWVPAEEVASRLNDWGSRWLFGFRDITAAMVERTGIFTILPHSGVGHSISLMLPGIDCSEINALRTCLLLANLNSLVADYVIRTKLTYIHLSYFVLKQIPVLPPEGYTEEALQFIVPRVLELVFVSETLKPFADDVWRCCDHKLKGAIQARWQENASQQFPANAQLQPFNWSTNRRAEIRAELDGYFAHLYGLTRDELRYVLDPRAVFGEDFPSETFRVLKEREQKEFGEYRTGRLVLEAFDKLAESGRFRDEMLKRLSAFESSRGAAKVTAS